MGNQILKVRERRTELIVSSKDRTTTFIHPAYGPNTYVALGKEMEQAGLITPTFSDTVDLVHAAFNSEGRYADNIINLMFIELRKYDNRETDISHFFGFTGVLRIPKVGVYIQDKPKIVGYKVVMNRSDLEKRLGSREERGVVYSDDGSVRFVPFTYKTGEKGLSGLDLAEYPYAFASLGDENSIEKLQEIVRRTQNDSIFLNLNSVSKPEIRFLGLSLVWSFFSWWLCIDGEKDSGHYRPIYGLGGIREEK